MDPLVAQFRIVASSPNYEDFVRLLRMTETQAADIRTIIGGDVKGTTYDERKGAVAILGDIIDKMESARKNLGQQAGGLDNESN